jgi:hypothetical protein
MQNEITPIDIKMIIKNTVRNNGMIVSWNDMSHPVCLYLDHNFKMTVGEAECFLWKVRDQSIPTQYHLLECDHVSEFIDNLDVIVKRKLSEGYTTFKYYSYADNMIRGCFFKEPEIPKQIIQDIKAFY